MISRFFRRRWFIIIACALITVFFALQLPKLKIENDAMFEYLPHSTEDYKRLSEAEESIII